MPTWKAKPTQMTASERAQVAPKGASSASKSDTVRGKEHPTPVKATAEILRAKPVGYHKGGKVTKRSAYRPGGPR